jgi:hypothetical protein
MFRMQEEAAALQAVLAESSEAGASPHSPPPSLHGLTLHADKPAVRSKLQSLRNKIEHLQLREHQRVHAKVYLPPPPSPLPRAPSRSCGQLLRPQLGLAEGEGDDEYVTALDRHTREQPGICRFWMPIKKRFCRFPMQVGMFCVEHQVSQSPGRAAGSADQSDENAAKSRRIPCPLDPKHTCDSSRLEAHLKVCPAKRDREAMERQVQFILQR